MLLIAVVYICTGRYSIFWKDFFESSEKYFLPETKKHYFVFTDDPRIINTNNITVIFRSTRGFPMDSFMRFEMFIQIEKHIKTFNYVFYFNSNMIFLEAVGPEIIPDCFKTELVGLLHPGYFNKSPFWFPYERNKRSLAFIHSRSKNLVYYAGGLFGGSSRAFIELCHTCDKWIKSDFSNNIIAIFHDESYLNKYFVGKEILKLNPGYSFPEGWKLPFSPKILLLNKIIHGGEYFEKSRNKSLCKKIKGKTKRFFKGLFWYLRL